MLITTNFNSDTNKDHSIAQRTKELVSKNFKIYEHVQKE